MSDRSDRDPARYLARIRTPVVLLGIAVVFLNQPLDMPFLAYVGFALIVAGLVTMFVPLRRPTREPVAVESPVRGRWVPVNSPADRVPSHGTHEFGQTYAIDLVHRPEQEGEWRGVLSWPLARPARTFPGFGQPIYAPAEGVVVKASGWQRDHWSRNSWPGLVYVIIEGFVRSLLSPLSGRFVLGNHVVLDLGDGVYAALAHLKRGSVRVRPGQRVTAGERLAECGNSGNSSEPHLHFQLMDYRSAVVALGVPFVFGYEIEGERRTGVPGGTEAFVAPAQVTAPGH